MELLTKPGGKQLIVALAFLFGALTLQGSTWLTRARPYWGVELVSSDVLRNGDVKVVADFIKGKCTLVNFLPVGIGFTGTSNLLYTDLDDRPLQGDRLAGSQTLRITVHTDGVRYDSIELRTRHNCSGLKVDRTFIAVPV